MTQARYEQPAKKNNLQHEHYQNGKKHLNRSRKCHFLQLRASHNF